MYLVPTTLRLIRLPVSVPVCCACNMRRPSYKYSTYKVRCAARSNERSASTARTQSHTNQDCGARRTCLVREGCARHAARRGLDVACAVVGTSLRSH